MRQVNLWLALILLTAALSLWMGRRSDEGKPAGEPARAAARGSTAPVAEDPVHLVVLNGTDVGGLAARMSVALATAGCVVERVDDAPHTAYRHSLLINRRLPDSRAGALARRLGDLRVLREWDDRASDDAVLVIGADHARIWASLRAIAPAPVR